jgi:hypothetical protein
MDDDDGGKRSQHISIDGKGKAVIDAHGKRVQWATARIDVEM